MGANRARCSGLPLCCRGNRLAGGQTKVELHRRRNALGWRTPSEVRGMAAVGHVKGTWAWVAVIMAGPDFVFRIVMRCRTTWLDYQQRLPGLSTQPGLKSALGDHWFSLRAGSCGALLTCSVFHPCDSEASRSRLARNVVVVALSVADTRGRLSTMVGSVKVWRW